MSHVKAKKMALKPDGYKCVISGVYDTVSCIKDAEVYKLAPGKVVAPTQLAHILPESSHAGVLDKGSDKACATRCRSLDYHATVWSTLTSRTRRF